MSINKKAESLKKSYPQIKRLINYVVRIAKEEEDPELFLEDVFNHGCQSGIVSELIYYSDTVKFFNKFKPEINSLLSELILSTGSTPETLFNGWDSSDPLAQDTTNKNLLAWFGFEEVARMLSEMEV